MVNVFNSKTLIALQIIASVIGIIWIGIQLYDYFKKKNESTL
jgi:Tfp pilus assembly major pilin PilA